MLIRHLELPSREGGFAGRGPGRRAALLIPALVALLAVAAAGQFLPQNETGPATPAPAGAAQTGEAPPVPPPTAAEGRGPTPAEPMPGAGAGRSRQGTPGAQGAARGPVANLFATTNLVNISFAVQNKHGEFVPGLKRADFEVFEDGRPQQIRFFSAESQLPLTLGWLLDTSPSQRNVLAEQQALSREFFRQVITPKDLAFVLGFDVDINLLQDLTSSPQLLAQAVDGAHIGGGGVGGSILNPGTFPMGNAGATHLWDAIVYACQNKLAAQIGRKAIIVVTDGDDQGSSATWRDAARALLDSNTVLYAVIAADPRSYGDFGYSGAGELSHVATLAGGRAFVARPKKIGAAFAQISAELRSQYTLAYRSDRPQMDGTFRRVKVELVGAAGKDRKVRAREGYYADAPPAER